MKKLFFILAAVLMAANMWAANTIQDTFMGLKLGQASQREVRDVLSSKGFELLADSGGVLAYRGNWKVEGVPVNNVVANFYDGTLAMIVVAKNCEDKCDSLQQILETNLDKKYGSLQSGDSSICLSIFSTGVVYPDMKRWTKMDKSTAFMYAKSDTAFILLYVAEKFVVDQFTEVLNAASKTSPDYAEENKVTGVAGVKFGDEKESVRKVITAKAQEFIASDAHSLNFYKVKIGGITYDYVTFYFAAGKGLVSVNMQRAFHSWQQEEARMAYENTINQFSHKYSNLKVLQDDPDEKLSTCGAFIDGYDYKPIIITLQKSLSKGGDIMYYVQVDYYYSRRENLYDDEI